MTSVRKTRSESRRALDQSDPSSLNRPRLPAEIINIITSLLSFEARIKVICLNRWFNQTFGSLLYRNIEISSTRQLVKLYRSRNVSKNLAGTQTFTIAQHLLWEDYWKGVGRRLEPVEYFGRVLQMTTSLTGLNIRALTTKFELGDPNSERKFMKEICRRALNPLFLPRLAKFEYYGFFENFQSLYHGRLLESIQLNVSTHFLDKNAAMLQHPIGASPSRLSLCTTVYIWDKAEIESANQVAECLGHCIAAGLTVRHLVVIASSLFLDPEIYRNRFEQLLLAWVRGFLSKGGGDNLESLAITFSLRPEDKSMQAQHSTIEEIGRLVPNLIYGILGFPDVQWRRNVPGRSNVTFILPDWTPCPSHRDLEVLRWWLEILGISINETPANEDLVNAAFRVQRAMLTRWPSTLVPSLNTLRTRMSTRNSDSVEVPNHTCTIA